ncbi:MAG: SCO family protein [Bacteroidota bacterium]
MSQRSNKRFLGGLAVAFLLPLSFYFIARFLSKDKIHLPGRYGVERVDSAAGGRDTVYHKIGDITLTNQLGEQVSLNGTLAGKIVVISFFFADCPVICPKLNKNVALLQKAFRKNPKTANNLDNTVHFLSITINPEKDTFQALRLYADRFGANHDHWWFLTGDRKTIYDFARNELHVGAGPGDGGAEDFDHSQQLVLLDKDRIIRGYYNGLDSLELRKCADDMVLLTMEKEHKRKKR